MPAIATLYFPSKVHAVQVRVHGYLHSVSVNLVEGHTGVKLLEFRSLVTELKRGTFPQSSNWVPLPEEYRKLRYAAVRGDPAALSQRGPVRPPPHALACRHLPAIAWNPCQLRSPGSTTQARTLSSAASPSGWAAHVRSSATTGRQRTTQATNSVSCGGCEADNRRQRFGHQKCM